MKNKKALVLLLIVTLIASAFVLLPVQAQQRGPAIDRMRIKIIRSPDAGVLAMKTREVDVMCGMIRPEDVEDLDAAGKTISSTSGFHMCNFIYNIRPELVAGPYDGMKNPLHDIHFRHALAHLIPKSRIIGSLFRYVNVQLDTMVPASMSEWHNTYVDDQPFSDPEVYGENCESVKILKAAGYTPVGDWPYSGWLDPDGEALIADSLRVYIPLEAVAPTSYMVGKIWVDQCHAIGLYNVKLSPEDFSPYIDKMYKEWNFEVGWTCYLLGRFPDYLYYMMHSDENYLGSSNPSGIYWDALDEKLDILMKGLNHEEKVGAVKDAQVMVAGGTPGDPLPIPTSLAQADAMRTDDNWNWSLVRLPVYNRNYYDSQQPELTGAPNARGWGLDPLPNVWMGMNIRWDTYPDPPVYGWGDRVDTDGKTFFIYLLDEYPERLNILWSLTVYAATFYQCYESLIDVNIWTHHDEPWLAENWEAVNLTGQAGYPAGTEMGVRFWLRDDVKWQDGTDFTVDDVKFAWEFLRDWGVPKYWGFSQHILDVQVDYRENSVTAFMDRTSQWDVYDLAGTAAVLPPQVWEKNPITGNNWTDVTEIESFNPAQAVPGGAYFDPGTPTYLYGTGPFVFQFYDQGAAYGDLDANRNYWLTTAEIEDKLEEYFWRSGDTNLSGKVYAEDMASIGITWGQKPDRLLVDSKTTPPPSWTQVHLYPPTDPRYDQYCIRYRDYPDNYITTNVDGTISKQYDFENQTKNLDPVKVILWIRIRRLPMDHNDSSFIDVWVYDENIHEKVLACSIGNIKAGWSYRSCDLSSILTTCEKVNKTWVHFVYRAGVGDVPPYSIIEIDHVYIDVFCPQFDYATDVTGPMGALPDGKTDLDDLVTAAKFFGETVYVPWP